MSVQSVGAQQPASVGQKQPDPAKKAEFEQKKQELTQLNGELSQKGLQTVTAQKQKGGLDIAIGKANSELASAGNKGTQNQNQVGLASSQQPAGVGGQLNLSA